MTPRAAEMGVGTLIIFIAMLLVAAVAAGVLIQTGGSLQEQSLSVGHQARTQISTNARTVEVSGTDGQDGTLEEFSVTYKLAPGSDPIKLSEVLLTESTENTTDSLKLRKNAFPVNDVWLGYYTATQSNQPASTVAFSESVPNEFWNVFSATQTSAMMPGKIAVAIVFVESNGSIDTNYENWTTTEEDEIINETRDALNWWANIEPRADISHTFEIYRRVPISYEPITRDTAAANQTLWITEALDSMGVPAGGSRLTRTFAFNDELRARTNAHWAFTFFVVDSSETGSGFTDGNAGIAYLNGPFTFAANNAFAGFTEAMLTHEFGHIFGAYDQYRSSNCSCINTSGYFPIETQNCDAATGCLTNTSSIMRGGIDTIIAYLLDEVDLFALAQVGLVDTDNNYLLDPIDILFDGKASTVNMSQETINALAESGITQFVGSIGFFAKEYLQEATNHLDNNLQRGDIVRILFEPSRAIGADEGVRITFIPKSGQSTLTEFITPDVMSVEKEYLYP